MLYNAGDCNISFKIYGKSGRPLLFLHGNGEDHLVFKNQIEYFQNIYKVIAVDTRGHGKSGRGTKPLDFDTISNDIIGLIKEGGAEKPDIVGFSDGANIAMHIAMKEPDLIGKLVLIGGNISPDGMKGGTRFNLKLCCAFWAFIKVFNKKAISRIEKLDLMLKHPKLSFSDLKKIKSKTLVIAGSKDVVKDAHTREIAANIKGSHLKIVNGDHFAPLKRHTETNNLILGFLINKKSAVSGAEPVANFQKIV